MENEPKKWRYRRESAIGTHGGLLEPQKPPGRLARAGNRILWVLFWPLVWWLKRKEGYQ